MLRSILVSLFALASPAQSQEAEIHPALERARTALEVLFSEDGQPEDCLEYFSASAREGGGEERILMFLGMFQRDLPDGEVRRVKLLESGEGEVVAYSPTSDAAAYLTFLLEAEPPHGIQLTSARLADGDPDPAGLVDGMAGDDMAAFLERFVGELAEADRFSGVVHLSRDGEVLFEGAYGLASRRFDVPNRVDTKFNLGSMNKMFTAVAVARLVADEKLSFDDKVADLLPDYPRKDLIEGVTVHHLLTHTSGMGSFWGAMFERDWTQLREPKDHLPLFVDTPLTFAPGSQFAYSNTGFLMLGLVIEEVSGQSYYDYVREVVYTPSGMTDSDSWAMDDPVPNLAIGYTRGDDGHGHGDGPLSNNLYLHRARGGPAGGGFSTVGDLMRFGKTLLAGKLVPDELLYELTTGKVPFQRDAHYGYGFVDYERGGARRFGHSGGAPGINALFGVYPNEGYTVVVLSNLDGGAMGVGERIFEMIERSIL